MSDAVIRAEQLTKVYPQGVIALNCVDLSVERGSVLGVLGANGAGKTTLIKLLLGLHRPTGGTIHLLGKRMTPNAAMLRRRLGYLPADPRFPPGMTSIQYLDFVGRLAGLFRRTRGPRVAALLRAVGLAGVSGEPVRLLSTGMRTRLAIAASLINDPEVLIWDEPTQGLDPEGRRSMLELIQSLAESKTLVLCSHFLSDIRDVCSHAAVLQQGQLIFSGPVEELAANVRPSRIEMALVGERKEIAETVKSLQSLEELESCRLQRNLLVVQIKPEVSHATALANVLVTLADHRLDITDLKVAGGQAEQAIAQLTIEEGSRGLTRAYRPVAA